MRQIAIRVSVVLLAGLGVACSKSSASSAQGEATTKPVLTTAALSSQQPSKKPSQLPRWARSIPQNVPAPSDVAAPPPNAEKTSSGLLSIVLKAPTGSDRARPQDTVVAHYAGWNRQGILFDSSTFHESKALIPKNLPLKGFAEALQSLSIGERRRFWIPTELGFGNKPTDLMQPPGELTMEVELVSVDRAPDPPPPPPDLLLPPANAIKTRSGLIYSVLKKGTGEVHPRGWDHAHLEFTGWNSDGKVFDSSIPERKPRPITVIRAMPGLAEALQDMVVGDKRRLWLSPELGHGVENTGDKPAGALVMDVELVNIVEGL